MWAKFVLAVFVIAGCESIGIYQQPIHYGPQFQMPVPVQKLPLPQERVYQCSCSDGVNTRNIPIRENDPSFGFITNYFTQPFRNIVSNVQSFFQNPQLPGMYGQPNVPNYDNKQYYQNPGGIEINQKTIGINGNGMGYSQDCLKNINYATSPCLAAFMNNLQSSRYQPFGIQGPGGNLQGVSLGYNQQHPHYAQANQPGGFAPSGGVKFSAPNGINANFNVQRSGLQLQAGLPQGGIHLQGGHPQGGIHLQGGLPQGGIHLQGGLPQGGANLFGGIGVPGFGIKTGLNANLNGNLNANINGGGGIGIKLPGLQAEVRSPLGIIRSNLPQGESGEVRSNLPGSSAEQGTEITSASGTDQPQTTIS